MNRLKTGVIAGLALAGSWTATAAAEDRTAEFSNKDATALLWVRDIQDTGDMATFGDIDAWDYGRHFTSITNIKLQRRSCGAQKWVTKASNPSRDGFHKWQDRDGTRVVHRNRARGLWRGVAVVAFKERRGAPVKWKKKITTPTLGDCHPVPPTP